MLTKQWFKNLWINHSKIVKIQMGDETNLFLTKVSDLVQHRLCLNDLKFCNDYKNIYINIIWCNWMTSDARKSQVISYNVKKYIVIYVFDIEPILNWILTVIEWFVRRKLAEGGPKLKDRYLVCIRTLGFNCQTHGQRYYQRLWSFSQLWTIIWMVS